MSRIIYKGKFTIVNTSYECGFSWNNHDIVYVNELNTIIPKFIILEVLLLLIIVSCYMYDNKIIISILLVILSLLSIYFSKTLKI